MLPLKKEGKQGWETKKIADGGMDRLKFICFIMNNIFYICVIYPASFIFSLTKGDPWSSESVELTIICSMKL